MNNSNICRPLVSVEGIIGAGKSFFNKLLKEHTDMPVICEPVLEWRKTDALGKTYNVLERFYKDPSRYAYELQLLILNSLEKQRKDVTHGFIERSLESNLIFSGMQYSKGHISAAQYASYQARLRQVMTKLKAVDGVIYIRTSVDTALKRIAQRGRAGENRITREYLEVLEKHHERWLHHKNKKVFIVNGEMDLSKKENVEAVMVELQLFLNALNL